MMESLLDGGLDGDGDAASSDAGGDDFADLAALLDGGDGGAADEPASEEEPAEEPADAFAQLAAAMGDAAPAAAPEPDPEPEQPEDQDFDSGASEEEQPTAPLPQPEPPAAAATATAGRLRSATEKLDDELGDLLASSEEEEAEPAVAEVASIAAAAIEQQLSDADVQALVLAKSAAEWCHAELGAPHASDCAAAMSRAMIETVGDLMFLVPNAAAVSTSLELPLDAAHALWEALAPYAEMMGLDLNDSADDEAEQPKESSAMRRSKLEERLTDDDAERTIREEQARRVAWLTQVPMFSASGVDRSFVEDLARKLEASTVRRGVLIIEKGQSGDEMFFIARARPQAIRHARDVCNPALDWSFF